MIKFILLVATFLVFPVTPLEARINLSAPTRVEETVLTIYSEEDLTLVRELREVSLREGKNELSFNWDKKQVDPTSIFFNLRNDESNIIKKDISYPPSTSGRLTWEVEAREATDALVEINYLTRGLDWRSLYHGRLNREKTEMDLEGYVRVQNNSDIQFENTRVNLLVGEINLLDELAEVIDRWEKKRRDKPDRRPEPEVAQDMAVSMERLADRPEETIEQEATDEHHLLDLGEVGDIYPDHDRRLKFTSQRELTVDNFFRTRLNNSKEETEHFLKFKNPSEEQPLPGGEIQLLRQSAGGELSYAGKSRLDYLPPGGEARLELGESPLVRAETKKMAVRSLDFSFDDEGKLTDWIDEKDYETTINNFRNIPVSLQLDRHFPHRNWEVIASSHDFQQIAPGRIRFELQLDAGEEMLLEEKIQLESN